jgi:hypothetical protein
MASISIWQDKIVLRTDEAIHYTLEKYAKWNDKFNAYLIWFSQQNLKRIFAAYGRIPVTRGEERIGQLKLELAKYKGMVLAAQNSKSMEDFSSLHFKVPPLGKYQAKGVHYLMSVKRAPLFADCGVGKTYMALIATENQIRSGVIAPGKTLVCGKLMTLQSGWKKDAERFTDLKVNVVWAPAYIKRKQKGQDVERKKELLELLNDPADIYVINHDGVFVLEKELEAMHFQKVIVDESTILKSYKGDFTQKGGKFGKAIMGIAKHADWRVIMSGTPAPNGPEDLWGQFRFLDDYGFFLEPSFHDFKQTYMEEIVFGKDFGAPSKWVCSDDAWQEIKVIIDPLAYQVSIRDHIDLPPIFTVKRSVEMGEDQTNHYLEMYTALSTIINDATIDSEIRLTQLIKLRQITGGFLIDNNDEAHPIKDATKLAALDDLIEEIGNEKIIIYAQYQWEIKSIESRYKDYGIVSVYGGNSSSKNLDNLQKFISDPIVKIIVLHPRSAAHGITLTNSHYMIFYSISYSAEENYQCIARIERASQEHTMFIYYLIAEMDFFLADDEYQSMAAKMEREGTIDEIIFEVVEAKEENQRKLISQRDINLSILKKF